MPSMNASLVHHIATLANIPITEAEERELADGFTTTLKVVDRLGQIDTSKVAPTHQVTGLENVWREDVVDSSRTFTQAQALANAHHTHQGYFVVPRVIGED